jgi:glutamate formiminotransferase/formiminotetrahydrofolate cyclodeaminase
LLLPSILVSFSLLGWDERWKEFSDLAAQGRKIVNELVTLVDEDTLAFQKIQTAMEMPRGTKEETATR